MFFIDIVNVLLISEKSFLDCLFFLEAFHRPIFHSTGHFQPILVGPHLRGCRSMVQQTLGEWTGASYGREISEALGEQMRGLLWRSWPEGDHGGVTVRTQLCLLMASVVLMCWALWGQWPLWREGTVAKENYKEGGTWNTNCIFPFSYFFMSSGSLLGGLCGFPSPNFALWEKICSNFCFFGW